MEVIVRAPALADVDELARINIDTWIAAYRGIVPDERLQMDLDVYRERWRGNVLTPRPGVRYIVGEIDGRVAGYSTSGPYRLQGDASDADATGLGEVYSLYVDPAEQGSGVGRAVHDEALVWLSTEYDEAAVWVLAANERGRAWYARQGWQEDGATSLFEAAGELLPEVRLRHAVGWNADRLSTTQRRRSETRGKHPQSGCR